ncbi:MAG: glycerate kinase [Rhodospirillales bacterium]|nr:glycerate kinase [Rhodospirillales bacterium]
MDNPQEFLRSLFNAAVAAADPMLCIPPHLPQPPKGRTVVIGAGKASAAMARAVETNWQGPLSGLVVTRYGFAVPCERIEIIEAAHPVPDAAGRAAAGRIVELAKSLGPDDLCIAVISGGASAVLTYPADGLTLEDKQQLNRALLRSGANIVEMNCVRKHLSAIKGGRLAQAIAPARIVTLLISDVPGDIPGVIGSGPTVADDTTFAEARAVIEKYGIEPPRAIMDHLLKAENETPKTGDPVFANTSLIMAGRPKASLDAAAAAALAAGVRPIVLGDAIEGETRDVARQHAQMARKIIESGEAGDGPCVLLSGGETTVSIKGQGRGGPNGEYALAMALEMQGEKKVFALSGDTDGIDGSEGNAGAMIDPDTLTRAHAAGLDAMAYLQDNDSYGFFEKVGGLLMTGPTCTNVNDLRAVLVLP